MELQVFLTDAFILVFFFDFADVAIVGSVFDGGVELLLGEASGIADQQGIMSGGLFLLFVGLPVFSGFVLGFYDLLLDFYYLNMEHRSYQTERELFCQESPEFGKTS